VPIHKLQRQKKTRSNELNSLSSQFQSRSFWTMLVLHWDREASSYFIATPSVFYYELHPILKP